MRALVVLAAGLTVLVGALVVEAVFDSAIAAWVALGTVLVLVIARAGEWLGVWFSGD